MKKFLVATGVAAGLVVLPTAAFAQTDTPTAQPTTTAPTTTAPTTTEPSPTETTPPDGSDDWNMSFELTSQKNRAGAHFTTQAHCSDGTVTLSSPALTFEHTGGMYFNTTVRDVAPGAYPVNWHCHVASGPNKGERYRSATFHVLPGGTVAAKPQVAKVPAGAPQTGDGSFSGTL